MLDITFQLTHACSPLSRGRGRAHTRATTIQTGATTDNLHVAHARTRARAHT